MTQPIVRGWHLKAIRVMLGYPSIDLMASVMGCVRQTLGGYEMLHEVDARVAGLYLKHFNVDVFKIASHLNSIMAMHDMLTFEKWGKG